MAIRERLSGNEAVATAMRQINPDVMAAFPITPSTEIPQYFSAYVANGKVDTEFVTRIGLQGEIRRSNDTAAKYFTTYDRTYYEKIYYLDYKNVVNEINKLKKEQLEYKIESNKLKGTIKTTGGTLLLTIPYENGFKIKVDSKSTNYEKVLDSFIGIELTEGEHEIIVEYEQPGLKFGIIVSGLSIITIMIFLKKGEKCEVNKKK